MKTINFIEDMARVNIGVNPKYLSDQHLIAESVEITMITGGLRANDYKIKSPIPDQFGLGTGHINFFKNKILYLKLRLDEVNKELSLRGIKNSTFIDPITFPAKLKNFWAPRLNDSIIIRQRIFERLKEPLRAKPGFHKYRKAKIDNISDFANTMLNSELFYV